MSEGLLRQRRNLIMTCILLWLMKYGGIHLHKMSIAGFDMDIERPEVIVLALWIVFAYFLYRYYQYFASDGQSKLESEFAKSLDARCIPLIQSRILKAHPIPHNMPDCRYFALKRNGWKINGHEQVLDGEAYGTRPFELSISRWNLRHGIILAIVESTFRSSVVTDYLLPFALADFVLWYCGSANWSGSFLHLAFDW